MKTRLTQAERQEERWAYLFIAPQIIGLTAFVLLPVIAALLLSFCEWELGGNPHWVGLSNYRDLFADDLFWKVLRNTVIYTVGVIFAIVSLSLLVALGLNSDIRGRTIYRAIYFLPAVTSSVAISLVWAWMYNPDFGLINTLLARIGIPGPGWTTSIRWSLPAVIIVGVWSGLGYNAVIFLAGLKGIPQEMYEAATIDGAGALSRFRDITIPLLTPSIFFVFVISTIGALQVFNVVYLLTNGGPANSSNVLVKYMFDVGFKYERLGQAAAAAWILFIIVAVLTAIQFRFSRWVYYE